MPETAEDKLNALVGRVGKVRRWLAALAIMKIAALCLIFSSVYIGVYAWLDHRLNFAERGRVIALILLLAGIACLLGRLRKLLLSHISCSGAANYIENRKSFNQQLVTAMEYHENKQEYPYSGLWPNILFYVWTRIAADLDLIRLLRNGRDMFSERSFCLAWPQHASTFATTMFTFHLILPDSPVRRLRLRHCPRRAWSQSPRT